MKAVWNGVTLAESEDTVLVEGNHYFPPDSLHRAYFEDSTTHTICPWKGEAGYYHVVANGQENKDAAWFYPNSKDAAGQIKGCVAFWKGAQIRFRASWSGLSRCQGVGSVNPLGAYPACR